MRKQRETASGGARQLSRLGAVGMLAAGALCAAVLSVASRVPPDPPDEGEIPGVVIGSSADGGTPAPAVRQDGGRKAVPVVHRKEAGRQGAAGRDRPSGDAAPNGQRPSERTGAWMAPAPSSPPDDDDTLHPGAARPGGDDDGGDDDRGAAPRAGEPADDDGAQAPPAQAAPVEADDAPDEDTVPASSVTPARVDDDEGPGGAATAAPGADSDDADD